MHIFKIATVKNKPPFLLIFRETTIRIYTFLESLDISCAYTHTHIHPLLYTWLAYYIFTLCLFLYQYLGDLYIQLFPFPALVIPITIPPPE